MSKPTFRVGMHRPTNVYVEVDPASPEDDPQIGYIVEGWAQVLVDQANEASTPKWTKDTTSVVMSGSTPGSRGMDQARLDHLLGAARRVLAARALEDLRGALVILRQAVSEFPYDQDADR